MTSPEANTTNTNVNRALYRTVIAAVHNTMPPWIVYLGVNRSTSGAVDGAVAYAGWHDPNLPELQDFLREGEP